MESEKVKEIKKAMECMSGICKDATTRICWDCKVGKKFNDETACKEALTLINDLESENEMLKQLREVDYKTMTTLRQANTELNECMDEMQDRIAELEEDKEKWQRKAVNYYKRAKSYGIECIIDNDIDETLKEFIDEK